MEENVWESRYLDAYDKVLLNSEIYLKVRSFHIKVMKECRIVLDSGAGTGNVTLELLKRGLIVHAIDNSEKALSVLQHKCRDFSKNLNTRLMDATNLNFDIETFDGITSMFVIYYLKEPEKYLEECYRVLQNQGILALTGRSSTENMELVLKSYEDSLKEKSLFPSLKKEFEKFSNHFKKGVMNSAINCQSFSDVKAMLERIGFSEITEYPNPYFNQCWSLTARKLV